jgi:hypothetical protein
MVELVILMERRHSSAREIVLNFESMFAGVRIGLLYSVEIQSFRNQSMIFIPVPSFDYMDTSASSMHAHRPARVCAEGP